MTEMAAQLSMRLAAIVHGFPLRPGIQVLEIGCGPCAADRPIAHRIGDGHILAIDRSSKEIERAWAVLPDEIAAGRLSVRQVRFNRAMKDLERRTRHRGRG